DFPPCMVVGIGYPDSSFPEWVRRRTKDFTPNEDEGDRARAAAAGRETPPDRAGGAEAFLGFLREEVVPLAESHGASPEQRTLLGHSLGGLFALYAMFQGSGLFSKFIIGSPSIWWGGAAIRRIEDEFLATKQPLDARVFLGVGGQEEASGAPELDSARMVSNTFLLASRLMGPAYPGVTAELQLFPGEGHGSMMAPFITRGLRALLVQA
ncbi:MAG: alpha/beta hydrolase-fold protein, partial [Dehalococcoidia bacterium]